jgi:hypothetical protein
MKTSAPKCSSCGGRTHWADEAWVCFQCGDEWYPDHGPQFASPWGPDTPSETPIEALKSMIGSWITGKEKRSVALATLGEVEAELAAALARLDEQKQT